MISTELSFKISMFLCVFSFFGMLIYCAKQYVTTGFWFDKDPETATAVFWMFMVGIPILVFLFVELFLYILLVSEWDIFKLTIIGIVLATVLIILIARRLRKPYELVEKLKGSDE